MDGLVGFLLTILQFEIFCLDFVNSCGSLLKLRHGLVLGCDGLSEGPSISIAHHFWHWDASTFDGVLSELAPFVGLVVHGDNFYEDGSVGPWISTWLAEFPSECRSGLICEPLFDGDSFKLDFPICPSWISQFGVLSSICAGMNASAWIGPR